MRGTFGARQFVAKTLVAQQNVSVDSERVVAIEDI
jgi:hypothetical protein